MEKVFWSDPYQQTLKTKVVSTHHSEYNNIIKNDCVIHKGYSDKVNQRRFWKIKGFSEVPCGGTHVKSTAKVGFIHLKRSHPGKSLERIEIKLVDDDTSHFAHKFTSLFNTPIMFNLYNET